MTSSRTVSLLLAAAIFLLTGCAAGPPKAAAPPAGSPAALNERGTKYLQKGDLNDGIRFFTEQEKQYPGNPLIPWWLGRLKMQGQYPDAADEFARAAAMRPADAILGEWVGIAHLQAGEPGKAADAFRKHVPARSGGTDFRFTTSTGVPSSPQDTLSDLLGRLAMASERAGRYDEAVDAQRRIYDMNPGGADYSRLSRLYSAAGRYDEALAAAKLALQKNESDATAHVAMGVAYEGKGRIDDAVRSYRKAIPAAAASVATVSAPSGRGAAGRGDIPATDPRAGRRAARQQSLEQRGLSQSSQGGYAAAPVAEEGAVRLSALFLGLGDFESAEGVLRKEERKRPGSAGLELGWPLFFLGKHADALEFAEREVRRHSSVQIGIVAGPDPAGAGVAIQRVEKGSPAESAGILAGDVITAVDGESMRGKPHTLLVQSVKRGAEGTPVVLTLARPGEKTPIERSVKRGVSLAKEAVPALGFRSLVYRAMGKPGPTGEDARRAAELSPDSFWALYATGLTSLDGGSVDVAADALEKAVAAAAMRGAVGTVPVPFVTHARLAFAGARARQGRLDEAESLYRAVPDAALSDRNVPLTKGRPLFLAPMKPMREGLLAAAAKSESSGKSEEVLSALSRALPLAETPAEAKAIRARIVKIFAGFRSLPEVPDRARRHGVRGEVFVKEGKMADALPEFRMASREAPYIPLFHFNRALVCGETGRYEEAIHAMEDYLALSPAAPNARQGKDAVIQWELKLEQQRKES